MFASGIPAYRFLSLKKKNNCREEYGLFSAQYLEWKKLYKPKFESFVKEFGNPSVVPLSGHQA